MVPPIGQLNSPYFRCMAQLQTSRTRLSSPPLHRKLSSTIVRSFYVNLLRGTRTLRAGQVHRDAYPIKSHKVEPAFDQRYGMRFILQILISSSPDSAILSRQN